MLGLRQLQDLKMKEDDKSKHVRKKDLKRRDKHNNKKTTKRK